MPNTPKGWPYPAGSDAPDGPTQLRQLAEKADAAVPFAMAAGSVNVNVNNSTNGSAVVTLPVGRFTQAPIVQLTKRSSAGGATGAVPMVTAGDAASFTAALYGFNAGTTITVAVHWTATQMDA